MIGYLKGKIVQIDDESCLLDVNGVGYCVYCSKRTLQDISKNSNNDESDIQLYTRLIHREDTMDLYGFFHKEEQLLFNLLLTVSGIGPKQSIKILGMQNAPEIVKAVVSEDSSFLMTLSGIGKKKELSSDTTAFTISGAFRIPRIFIDCLGPIPLTVRRRFKRTCSSLIFFCVE